MRAVLSVVVLLGALAAFLAFAAGSAVATYQVMVSGSEAPWWAFVGYAGMIIACVLGGYMGMGSNPVEGTIGLVVIGMMVAGVLPVVAGHLGDEVVVSSWLLMAGVVVGGLVVIWGPWMKT